MQHDGADGRREHDDTAKERKTFGAEAGIAVLGRIKALIFARCRKADGITDQQEQHGADEPEPERIGKFESEMRRDKSIGQDKSESRRVYQKDARRRTEQVFPKIF